MHSASARRFLYFLLVTLLINAGGWTFNREAVADVFFGEQETVATTGWPHSAQTGHLYGESIKAKTPCNHWCHESAHFLGLFDQALTLSPKKPVEGYFSQITRFIPEPVPEDLFRPPRLLF